MNFISQNIRTLRNHFNLTQDDLAIKIDTKRHNIAQWEVGRSHPSVEMLQKLCDLFEIPLNDVISKELDEHYFNKLEEQTAIYYNANSDSAITLVKFLQDELRAKNEIIKSLIEILNSGDSNKRTL